LGGVEFGLLFWDEEGIVFTVEEGIDTEEEYDGCFEAGGCVEGGGLAKCFVGKNSGLGIVDEGGVPENGGEGRFNECKQGGHVPRYRAQTFAPK